MDEIIQSPNVEDEKVNSCDASHLIGKLDSILSSPSEFTSKTPETEIFPLLEQLRNTQITDENVHTKINILERWCKQLDDTCRAAYSREQITHHLKEVEAWEEWAWEDPIAIIQGKKSRTEEIQRSLTELPIEWLKTRVTGIIFGL